MLVTFVYEGRVCVSVVEITKSVLELCLRAWRFVRWSSITVAVVAPLVVNPLVSSRRAFCASPAFPNAQLSYL